MSRDPLSPYLLNKLAKAQAELAVKVVRPGSIPHPRRVLKQAREAARNGEAIKPKASHHPRRLHRKNSVRKNKVRSTASDCVVEASGRETPTGRELHPGKEEEISNPVEQAIERETESNEKT